jgi:hypothetical protein
MIWKQNEHNILSGFLKGTEKFYKSSYSLPLKFWWSFSTHLLQGALAFHSFINPKHQLSAWICAIPWHEKDEALRKLQLWEEK